MTTVCLRAHAPTCARRAALSGCSRRAALMAGATALLFALVRGVPASAVEWDIEAVEPAMMFITSNLSMALAPDGTPHIAHSMEHYAHYLKRVDGVWTLELPYTAEVGASGLALALDPAGEPWLVFGEGGYYEDTWPLRIARRMGGVWSVRSLPDELQFVAKCDIAFDRDGVPHIAYGDNSGTLRHGWLADGEWRLESVGIGSATGFDVALALDSTGRPYISHWQSDLSDDHYESCTWWNGTMWKRQVLDEHVGGCNCIGSGIALDFKDNPHVAWETHYCRDPVSVRYATYAGGTWQVSTIERDFTDFAAGCSLAVDRSGAPHVAYGTEYSAVGGSSQLRYAHRNSAGTWVHEVVDADGDCGEINSIRIDRNGFLHIAYFAGDGYDQGGEIRYARSREPVGPGPGDLNCDGALNGYDIDPFVLALIDAAAYAATFPDCDRTLADINGDGAINGYDIDPFVQLLTGG
jgi:hypothetical protein